MGDAEIQEAAAAVQLVTGFSNYLAGVQYDLDKYMEELEATVDYITSQGGHD
jgi:hypothetical protein